jgi:2-dehydro-3-deoxygluconokinase
MTIGCFGECMLEQSQTAAAANAAPRFGGDTLNTTLYLARCLRLIPHHSDVHCLPPRYFTAVGSDQQSQQLLLAWQAEGIDISAVQQLSDKTLGRYQIRVDAQGERSFSYQRADSAARAYFRQQPTALQQQLEQGQLTWCYLSGISLAILAEADRQLLWQSLQLFVANGGKLVYDNNYRPQLWSAADAARWQQLILPHCQLALLTDSDEKAIYGWHAQQSLAVALAAGCPLVMVKQGAAPCLVGWQATAATPARYWQVAAETVTTVVDTSAAGDAFAAGVLAVLCTRTQWQQADIITLAIRTGHRLAAAVLCQHGAIIAPSRMPDLSDLWLELVATETAMSRIDACLAEGE